MTPHFKSHPEAMASMLDFFYYNEISPKEIYGPTGRTIEPTLTKRIDAPIAILGSIEKTHTKPTMAMFLSVLEMAEFKRKPLILKKKRSKDSGPNFHERH
ncbi:hypothetical protein M8845_09275 [Gelidibacter japonicus]|uniref:BfmA/BtgA family mobilization protein n=1 Tax=Gelidibacter japonicus TaxID=1962232 RepID=UPI002020DD23|nr:BfmA/BtgA family mobilization protein [Gelidibacter japonicus]MCL8007614.1 hypothetical protein [Gelidibacter japonicus]